MGQKIYRAELDKSMFKAWTSWEAGATEVAEPEAIDNGAATFNCENNLYKTLEGGNVVFGNTNVYYLWYADLTGTKTIYAEGTAGLQLRILMNRPEPVEGGDAHGGKTEERVLTIGDDGKGSIDVSDLAFVHLNCVKVQWGGSGIVKAFYIEGTVKPVTGILSVISNGDAEGTDLSSFPVSYDGPNNGGTANDKPEIVGGGVNGSKCFKVTSFDSPTETWHTQFYVKSDEVMPKGSKWALKMSIKADRSCTVTNSAQAAPRTWKGDMGLGEITVTTEWQNLSWSGEIGVDDFQSIAFDLNNEGGSPGNASNTFYFDNIEFGYDLGGSNPLSNVQVSAASDVIRVDFAGMTNMKDLVKNALTNTLIYDNSCASVTINGEPSELVSVEGFSDGNLYLFLLEDEVNEEDVVKVAFKNPVDAAHQLVFTAGKYEGEPVPEFSGLEAAYLDGLGDGDYVSYLWGAPMLAEVDPENGSFNMPANFKVFNVTFNQEVKVESVVAKLGSEALTASGEGEFAKTVKLTRTSDAALNGAKELVISKAVGEKGRGLEEDIVLKYSFGPVSSEAQPEVIYASNFTSEGDNADGAGWKTTADGASSFEDQTLQDANSGAGNRLQHGQAGYAADVLYLAQRTAVAGIALYGLVDDYKLELRGGVTYHLTLKSAQWDAYADQPNRTLRAQILTEDAVNPENGEIIDQDGILGEEFKVVEGRVKENKDFTAFDIVFTPAQTGNFVIRLVSGNLDGNPASYGDGNAIADVKVEFIPDVLGIVEDKNLNDALAEAKETYDDISIEERYAGAALNALDNLIKEVETEKVNYTAPSLYVAKTAELKAAVKAVNDHKAACDTYDENIVKAIDLVAQYEETKFNITEVFAALKTVVAKYHASKEVVNLGDEEEPIYDATYTFDKLTDDDALAQAVSELNASVSVATYMFTEGASKTSSDVGIKVLVDRIRQGVEGLIQLGVPEDDNLIVRANKAVTDDDALAEELKGRLAIEYYKRMKENDQTLFEEYVDEETMETLTTTYNFTAFVKNPNTYAWKESTGVTPDNCPGWTLVQGNAGLTNAWNGGYPGDIDGLPKDLLITQYHAANRIEQTITDLPVGMYKVMIDAAEWSDEFTPSEDDDEDVVAEKEANHDMNRVYVKTSATPVYEEGQEEPEQFAADMRIDHHGQYVARYENFLEPVLVTDGQLTIGVKWNALAQFMFDRVQIFLAGGATGFDYAKGYEDAVNGIEAPAAVKVRAVELYNLNGRRIITAQKGIQIVKKYMNDGSVRIEKVIKK